MFCINDLPKIYVNFYFFSKYEANSISSFWQDITEETYLTSNTDSNFVDLMLSFLRNVSQSKYIPRLPIKAYIFFSYFEYSMLFSSSENIKRVIKLLALDILNSLWEDILNI